MNRVRTMVRGRPATAANKQLARAKYLNILNNIKKHDKRATYNLISYMLISLLAFASIFYFIANPAAQGTETTQKLITTAVKNGSWALDKAIALLRTMKYVPQVIVNAGTGASMSMISNVIRGRKISFPRMAGTASLYAGTGSYFPRGNTLLESLEALHAQLNPVANNSYIGRGKRGMLSLLTSTTVGKMATAAMLNTSSIEVYAKVSTALLKYSFYLSRIIGLDLSTFLFKYTRTMLKTNNNRAMNYLNNKSRKVLHSKMVENINRSVNKRLQITNNNRPRSAYQLTSNAR
jgi:hypothetical protein